MMEKHVINVKIFTVIIVIKFLNLKIFGFPLMGLKIKRAKLWNT